MLATPVIFIFAESDADSFVVVEADDTAGVEEEEARVVEAMHELEGLTEEPVFLKTQGSEPPRQVSIIPTEGEKLSKSDNDTTEETNVEFVLDQATHGESFFFCFAFQLSGCLLLLYSID